MKNVIDRKKETKKPITLTEAEVVFECPEYDEQKNLVVSRLHTLLGEPSLSKLLEFVRNMNQVTQGPSFITDLDYLRMLVFEVQYGSHLKNGNEEVCSDLQDKAASFMIEKMVQDIFDEFNNYDVKNGIADDDLPFESKKRKFNTIATFEEYITRIEPTKSKK